MVSRRFRRLTKKKECADQRDLPWADRSVGNETETLPKRRKRYTSEKIGKIEIVKDFLPKSEGLIFRETNLNGTVNMSKSTGDCFRESRGITEAGIRNSS